MPSLSDRSFNPGAWRQLAFIAVGLVAVMGLVAASYWAYGKYVEAPRVLAKRFDEPPGQTGALSAMVSRLGVDAAPTLVADLGSEDPIQRSKSLELLGAIEDPRARPMVLDGLKKGLTDKDLGVRLAALAGLTHVKSGPVVSLVWPLTTDAQDVVRQRAWVALGVVGEQADADKLLREVVPKLTGQERHLASWAAGRIARRLAAKVASTDLPAAKDLMTEAEVRARQAEVDGVLAAIDLGEDPSGQALKLAELTDVGFADWNAGHQLAVQVIAVHGPTWVRGVGGSTELAPTPDKLQLKLRDRGQPQP